MTLFLAAAEPLSWPDAFALSVVVVSCFGFMAFMAWRGSR